MKMTPAKSVLSNSPHTAGKEQKTPYGVFQIEGSVLIWQPGQILEIQNLCHRIGIDAREGGAP